MPAQAQIWYLQLQLIQQHSETQNAKTVQACWLTSPTTGRVHTACGWGSSASSSAAPPCSMRITLAVAVPDGNLSFSCTERDDDVTQVPAVLICLLFVYIDRTRTESAHGSRRALIQHGLLTLMTVCVRRGTAMKTPRNASARDHSISFHHGKMMGPPAGLCSFVRMPKAGTIPTSPAHASMPEVR